MRKSKLTKHLNLDLKPQPACYCFEWVDKSYVGSTANMKTRMPTHVAAFNTKGKITRSGQRGQLELYTRDLKQASIHVDYYDTKQEALEAEHKVFQSLGPDKLINTQSPKHKRVLCFNVFTDKCTIVSSAGKAAALVGANRANVFKAIKNGGMVKGHKFFRV